MSLDRSWSTGPGFHDDQANLDLHGADGEVNPDALPDHLSRIIESEDDPRARPLSVQGAELRPECIDSQSGRALDWRTCTAMWRDWLKGYQNGHLVFEDAEGRKHEIPANVRFGEQRSKRDYARLHNLHQGLEAEWDDLHIAMLSFTASNRNTRGGYRCPADHLNDLKSSQDAVLSALRRRLDGREFCYVWVTEPHKSGYAHRHLAVFTQGPVSQSAYEAVLDAHVRNCPTAGAAAHDAENALTIEAVDRQRDEAVNSIAYYLAEYIADSFQQPQEAPGHVQRFNALLWATGTRRIGYSQNAAEYRRKGYEGHTGESLDDVGQSDWDIVGFRDSDTDTLHEIDPEDSGIAGLYISCREFVPDIIDPPSAKQ